MADIVVGLASSHTPQMSTETSVWGEHAQRDRGNPNLIGTDGARHTFDELVELAPPNLGAELTSEAFALKDARMKAGLARLSAELEQTGATVAVVIGNDHKEMFGDDALPAFAVYHGTTIADFPLSATRWEQMPADLRKGQWAYHGEEVELYPVESALGRHLLECLMESGFDPTQVTTQAPGRILGHAWTFPRRRIMGPRAIPMVPVHLNTMYPPNIPSPARCYRFGIALGDAIRQWSPRESIAVIATGGLSHFVVDEALDRGVLQALCDDDETALAALPKSKLQSGTSEILNWVVAAGALRGLAMSVVDYIPAYRSEAGTGVGIGFALWR